MTPDDKKNEIIEAQPESSDGAIQAESAEASAQSQSSPSSDDTDLAGKQFSVVATTPQYKKAMFIGLAIVVLGTIYYIFFGRSLTPQEEQKKKMEQIAEQREKILKASTPVASPSATASINIAPPKLPSPPPLTAPTPPAPPPPPVPLATFGQTPEQQSHSSVRKMTRNLVGSNAAEEKRLKELEARRKAGIMVMGGGGGAGSADSKDHKDGKDATDKKKSHAGYLGFGNGSLDGNTIPKSSAGEVKATKIENLEDTVIEGTMINAVLETAINTDLPGMLRAIISRDVYGASGRNVLIPKGSRVIGSYSSQVENGQSRVAIIWSRLIRPDGIDIAINSPATDALGRAGVEGRLDSKFWSQIAAALLVSYIIPVITSEIAGVNPNSQMTTTTTTGVGGTSTTNQSTFNAQQAIQAEQSISAAGQKAISKAFSSKPTITVNQGTAINIFVQKDLVFPSPYLMVNVGVMK